MNEMSSLSNMQFFEKVAALLNQARNHIARSVNETMTNTYFEIGRMIVEEEQQGEERAAYGKELLADLSKRLTSEFGKGFSATNLRQMRTFFLAFEKQQTVSAEFKELGELEHQEKQQTVSAELADTLKSTKNDPLSNPFPLSWSHYLRLMRISDEKERRFYEIECLRNNWSLREFKRQYDTSLYERLALSRDKEGVRKLSEVGQEIQTVHDLLKDPYVLEFVGLPEKERYSELDLESAIIEKLEHFLLELGQGFTFVGRQERISFDDKHFWVDLVFFNRILQSFVLIDLKIGELSHQDLGQMQMYVNFYDRHVRLAHEHKTVGIILCKEKNETLVKISLPEDNDQIFASRYKTVIPSKEQFKALLDG